MEKSNHSVIVRGFNPKTDIEEPQITQISQMGMGLLSFRMSSSLHKKI